MCCAEVSSITYWIPDSCFCTCFWIEIHYRLLFRDLYKCKWALKVFSYAWWIIHGSCSLDSTSNCWEILFVSFYCKLWPLLEKPHLIFAVSQNNLCTLGIFQICFCSGFVSCILYSGRSTISLNTGKYCFSYWRSFQHVTK